MKDDRLLIICDCYIDPPREFSNLHDADIYFWWSEDEGENWSEPSARAKTSLQCICPGKILEIESNTWLIPTHLHVRGVGSSGYLDRKPSLGYWRSGPQQLYRSTSEGEDWEGPIIIYYPDSLHELCEGSIIQLYDETLVCYMRENTRKGMPSMKSLSFDNGLTWDGPYPTLMNCCHVPRAGVLQSGRVLITYRHYPGGAGYWAKNFFAYIESMESASEKDRMKQQGIILPLDHDRSIFSESGYSNWIQLSSGEVFAVNYITNDASTAQIRGYFFSEEDF